MRRLAAVAVLAGLTFVGLATPALAHNSLIGSNPADKASVEVGPQSLTLTFDQPVQGDEGVNTISIRDPQGNHWEAGPPQASGTDVTAPVRPLGPSGVYSVTWRVLSADGHPVQGALSFTLSKAGTGTPIPAEDLAKFSNASNTQPGKTDEGGIPTWVWIVGAILVLGLGIVFALRMGGKEEDA